MTTGNGSGMSPSVCLPNQVTRKEEGGRGGVNRNRVRFRNSTICTIFCGLLISSSENEKQLLNFMRFRAIGLNPSDTPHEQNALLRRVISSAYCTVNVLGGKILFCPHARNAAIFSPRHYRVGARASGSCSCSPVPHRSSAGGGSTPSAVSQLPFET